MTGTKKLLVTGGHVTPALAVIDEIKSRNLPWSIVFVGRRYINDREVTMSFEYEEVTKRRIPFIHLKTGRLTRLLSVRTFINIFYSLNGLLQGFAIINKEKPDYILSFGGYLALPIALAAYIRGIPVYTHEQTIHPGLANKIIASLAKKVFVSFEESKDVIKSDKIVVSGNPLRPSIFVAQKKVFEIPEGLPCLYITGGSLGAHSINTHIERILPDLLQKYVVMHQTGNVKEFQDYDRLLAAKMILSEELSSRYFIKEHFADDEIGWVYQESDLVIGRSGANTFFELIALKKPAIFIPLPWSAHDEQRKQAQLFKQYGIGEVFEQNRPSTELLKLITDVQVKIEDYKTHFSSLGTLYQNHATNTIIETICKA